MGHEIVNVQITAVKYIKSFFIFRKFADFECEFCFITPFVNNYFEFVVNAFWEINNFNENFIIQVVTFLEVG